MWLLIPILIYSIVYLCIRHIYTYWQRKGFPAESTGLSLTFLKKAYKREFQHVQALSEIYENGSLPFLGFYHFFRPTLMVRSVMLAHQLLENSNGHFANTKWDYVKGYRRFNLLERLGPIFCNTRVEGLFRNIEKVADNMVTHLLDLTPSDTMLDASHVDLQQVCRIFAVNIISNLIYGMDLNIFTDNANVFGNYLRNSMGSYTVNSYTMSRLPKRSSLTYRLRDVLRENVELREEGSKIRKDVLQLLVKFRNGNDLSSSAKLNWHVENVFVRDKVISIKVLSRIAEEFLHKGFDSIVGTITFTLYEVLREPDILQKILAEIRTLPPGTDEESKLSYKHIEELKYLDLCVKETLRKYPAVPYMERICRKSYNIPDSRYIVGSGKPVVIPILAIQHDEQYFPDPDKYKPHRFVSKEQHNKEAFLAYGLGAGTCIAQNFSNIVIKVALVKLFQTFTMSLNDADLIDIGYSPAPYIKSRKGLNVKLKANETKTTFSL